MNSSECLAARAQLDAALEEPATPGRARRLEQVRSLAAKACLGPSRGRRERSGAPQPVQVVPAPVISAGPAPATPAVPAPPLAIPRPATITTCDPGGCWDSEGRRLNHMGPLLMGPRGLCSLQGGTVNCP